MFCYVCLRISRGLWYLKRVIMQRTEKVCLFASLAIQMLWQDMKKRTEFILKTADFLSMFPLYEKILE